ncbi:MAG: SCO family protein [Burkholderiaceae bacterium]
MAKMDRRTWLAMAGMAPFASTAWAQARGEKYAWPDMSARETIRKRYFPDVILRTHENRSVRLYEDCVKDRFVTINFMYTNCIDGTCPVTTYNLTLVQQLLKERVGRDIFMLSITLDPEHDTPNLLNRYARSYGVGPGWLFLRAEPKDTEMIRRKLGFYDRDPAVDAKKANHVAMLRYGDEPRQLWNAINAMVAPRTVANAILSAADLPGPNRPGWKRVAR